MSAASEIMDMLAQARLDVPRRIELGGTGKSWWVYGAGKMGRKVAKALQGSGRHVKGFIDPAKHGVFDGLECLGIDAAMLAGAGGSPVALGLHNPMVDASRVRERLVAAGFASVWMPQELVEALPSISNFWLAPISAVDALDLSGIEAALDCYLDEQSVNAVASIARWRWLSDASALPEPDVAGQYSPDGLGFLPSRLRMVDCGAYVGDTLDALVARGHEIESYVGLEPDPKNYAKLAARVGREDVPCLALPCGAWSDARMLVFVPDDAAGSVRRDGEGAGADGALRIQTLSIDEAFYSMRPNFIKMDIEGAESEALAGAARCIGEHQPSLAVSSYHHPMDLWVLPIQIKTLMMVRGGKLPRMAMRCHAMASFDSVVYAWR